MRSLMNKAEYRNGIREYVQRLTSNPKDHEIDIIYLINYIKLLGIPITVTNNCVLFDLSKLDNERLQELYNFVQTIKKQSASILLLKHENVMQKYKKELQSQNASRKNKLKSRESFLKTPIIYDDNVIKFSNINNKKNTSPYFLQLIKPLRKPIIVGRFVSSIS